MADEVRYNALPKRTIQVSVTAVESSVAIPGGIETLVVSNAGTDDIHYSWTPGVTDFTAAPLAADPVIFGGARDQISRGGGTLYLLTDAGTSVLTIIPVVIER